MKIIFITPKLNFKTGGGSIFDIDLKARAIQTLGAEVEMVTVYSQNNKIPFDLKYPLRKEYIKAKRQLSISYQVYKILKKYEKNTDFFHIDGHIFLYGAGLYKKLGGKVQIAAFFNRELIVFPQDIPSYNFGLPDPFMPKQTFLRKIKKSIRYKIESTIGMWLANEMEISIFTSPIFKKIYNKFGLNTKYQLISPDLSGGVIKKQNVSYPQKNENNKVQLVAAGRLIPTKGFDLLIKALSLSKQKNNIHLTLAGGGPDEERLKKMSKNLATDKNITFTGWLEHDQLFPLFKKSDVFIIPRWRYELTSVVMVEAMSFGLPCVVSANGALDWQVGEGAITFEHDNPQSLAQAIDKICTSLNLRIELSKKSLQRIDELHYSNWVNPLYKLMRNINEQNYK